MTVWMMPERLKNGPFPAGCSKLKSRWFPSVCHSKVLLSFQSRHKTIVLCLLLVCVFTTRQRVCWLLLESLQQSVSPSHCLPLCLLLVCVATTRQRVCWLLLESLQQSVSPSHCLPSRLRWALSVVSFKLSGDFLLFAKTWAFDQTLVQNLINMHK